MAVALRQVAPLLAVFPSRAAAATLLAPCLPAIAETLGATYGGVGSVIGAVYLGYGAAVLAVGLLGRRVAPRVLLVAGAAVQVLAVVGFTLAPSVALARVAAVLYGTAGVADLAATALLAAAGGARRGRLLSVAHGAYALAAVAVPLAAGAVLEAGGTWRMLFAGAAALNVAVFAWVTLSGSGARDPGADGPSAVASPASPDFTGLRPWRLPAFRSGVGLMALYIAGEVGPAIWLPTWFRDRFDLPMATAALSTAVFWGAMSAGRLLLASRVDHGDPRRTVSRLAVAAALAWAGVLASPHPAVALAAVALFGLAMSVGAPVLQGLATRPFPGAETAMVGWMASASGAVGAVLPWAIGAVAESAGGPPGPGAGRGLTWALAGTPVFLAMLALAVRRVPAVSGAGLSDAASPPT